jgi:hypothetical protein
VPLIYRPSLSLHRYYTQTHEHACRRAFTVKPTIQPEIPGRIVSLTMAIVSSGQEIQRQTWNVDTQGVLDQGWIVRAQGAPCTEFHFQFTEQEFRAMFDGGRAPLLRVIMDVR